jgi:protein SCO1/2
LRFAPQRETQADRWNLNMLPLLVGLFAFPPADTSRLAVIQDAPAFTLTTQQGKELGLRDLRGKVLLVGFVFTTCSGSCPATTSRMVQVQQRLQEKGLFKEDRVRLLTISLDPVRDTPEAMQRYAKLFDADTSHWSFLTGTPQRVEKVLSTWGMWTKPAANGQLDHPSRIFLVDGKGRIREIYDLAFLKAPWVVEDIETLLAVPACHTYDLPGTRVLAVAPTTSS